MSNISHYGVLEFHNRVQRLSQLLSRQPAPPGQVIPVLISVLTSVEDAHKEGRQHRYLSPNKIRLTGNGTAEVPASLADLEETIVYGSTKHAAPEDLDLNCSFVNCGVRDAYVLGFIFYEILLGEALFESEFRAVTKGRDIAWLGWHSDKTKSAKPLSRLIPGFPLALSAVIEEMIAKDPSQRVGDLDSIIGRLCIAEHVTLIEKSTRPRRVPLIPIDKPPDSEAGIPAKAVSGASWFQSFFLRLRESMRALAVQVKQRMCR